ncbi:putative multi antimicrobial extrusion protein [Helianthus anomalus]
MANAEVAISAFSICLNLNELEFMISLGFLGVACVRVANELGRGNVKTVRFSIQVLLGTSIAIGVSVFVLWVAIGGGMQGAVAIVNLVFYYLIGIPLGALLGYTASLQVKGIWIGMIGGVVTQTITLAYMTWRTNWDDEVKKASERLGRFYLKSHENSDQISI